MLNRWVKNKLGRDKDVPAAEQFYSPLRIALHSTIELTVVDMMILKESLHPKFTLPQPPMSVLAIGKLEIHNTPMYRVYLKDSGGEEYILQVVEGKDYRSGEPTVEELILFQQVVTIEPQSESSLDRCLSNIGFQDLKLDEIEYDRTWGDQFTEKLELAECEESIVEPNGTVNVYQNHYVLYGREVDHPIEDDKITEHLLVGLEEDSQSAQVAMQIGLKLNTTDVKVQ